jgi:hypothetical protein
MGHGGEEPGDECSDEESLRETELGGKRRDQEERTGSEHGQDQVVVANRCQPVAAEEPAAEYIVARMIRNAARPASLWMVPRVVVGRPVRSVWKKADIRLASAAAT